MNPKQLIAHFDRISEAPDAIPQLRRFIRALAVLGKLLPQNEADEPASAALKRLNPLEKPPRYAKRSPELIIGDCGLSIGDPGTPLPTGWARVPMITIARLESGHTPSRHRSDWWDVDVPWIGLVDARLHDGGMILETIQHTNADGIANSAARVLPTGTVCFSRTASVGYVVIMGRPMATSQDFVNWVPTEVVDSQWLQLVLIAEKPAMARFSKGAIHQTVYYPAWLSMHISLPPLAEQHRIVAKVDELMALCDLLEAAQAERESRRDRLAASSLHRLNNTAEPDAFREHARFHLRHLPRLTTRPEQIQQLRQTILNLAVRGRLVPQVRDDEPASELLKRIRLERVFVVRSGTIEHPTQIVTPEARDLLSELPDTWELVRVGDLLLGDSRNGYSKKPDDAPDGIPILRISACTARNDAIVAEEEHKLIGGVSSDQREQYALQPGDLLACRFNGNQSFVGKISLYLGYLSLNPIYPDKLIRLRLMSQFVLPSLVRRFAESDIVRRDIERYCATTVGNWGISASNLKEVKIPLPPFAEQHRIVAKVDELMALCDRLEEQLITIQATRRRLLDAFLYDAHL